MSEKPLQHRVLDLLDKVSKRSNRWEIAERLNLRGAERKQLTAYLKKLVRGGLLEERKGLYRLPAQQKKLEGVFSKTERGFGFLRLTDSAQEDIFIAARDVGTAMDGDQVLGQAVGRDRSGRPYGRIVKILQRAHSSVLGVYHQERGRSWVEPLDPRLGKAVYVRSEEANQIRPGQVVNLEFTSYSSATTAGSGRIVEVLGEQDDPQVDIEMVIRTHQLPQTFSAEALAEAAAVAGSISVDELAGRKDLRRLPLMTIDGETARDFDDAVALRREKNGHYRLWVCIADVAHYVAPGGALDVDALERGTSVYFPGFCLPMLPEQLSNGICSLVPGQDRLVMAAELLFDQSGQCLNADFYQAVICSRARLTYTEVAAYLDDPEAVALATEIADQLPEMAELAEILGRMRFARGSLELDVPELEIILDEKGFPVGATKCHRTMAHRLIEEFMLAANEATAAFLERRNYAFLYRIHEPPALDKLQEFQQLAAECGVGLILTKDLQRQLQNLLTEIAERPEARLLNQQLLRSLQQARYAPENKGHFGLAAESYCHFTSPIRRYPDLTVHRTLKRALVERRQEQPVASDRFIKLGQECSDKERRALAAERDLLELRCCQLMKGQVGAEFFGTVSSVTEFGFFVELDELFVEGLVHVRSLAGDYYSFDPGSHSLIGERRRRSYRVGMRVKVRVERVDLWRRRLDFVLVEQGK